MLDLDYPALRYGDKHISGNLKKDCFRLSIESFIDEGGYVGDIIIDSSGKRYRILSLTKKGPKLFSLHNLYRPNKYIKIDLELEPLESIDFETFREFLIDFVQNAPKKWGAKYHRKEAIEYYRSEDVKTIKDLIRYDPAMGVY